MTAAVALMVALALAGAGAIVYAIELQRIQEQVLRGVDRELAELASLEVNGTDPLTRKPFPDVGTMLDTFLARNVPAEGETLVSWYDGGPRFASPSRDFVDTELFRQTVTPLIADNGTSRIEVPSYGDTLITVQTVRKAQETGALVVVSYLDRSRAGLQDTMRTYAIVSMLSLLLVTALAAWQSGRLLSPLRTLRETAEDIRETELARRLPVRGNDDITALTRTFNGMLDRIESAFVGQRQFLDDAGHELRTPLTVLRGHLELLDADNPADVAETQELLLDEVDRMSRLVQELLVLASSDRPDFVTPHPVDLARLTEELVAKSRGLGDRTWLLDEAATVRVELDEQRITQAVLQLADNAVKHTGAGDRVAIGSAYDGSQVRLWVRDSGPGVPAADRDLIFERFGRSTVPEGDEGFGLGLSIVRAIASAHNGSVSVEQAEPTGARFVICLPAVLPPDRPEAPSSDPAPDRSSAQAAVLEEEPWPAS